MDGLQTSVPLRLDPAVRAIVDKPCDTESANLLTGALSRAGLVNLELISGLVAGSGLDFVSDFQNYLVEIESKIEMSRARQSLTDLGNEAASLTRKQKSGKMSVTSSTVTSTSSLPPIMPSRPHRLNILAGANSVAGSENNRWFPSTPLGPIGFPLRPPHPPPWGIRPQPSLCCVNFPPHSLVHFMMLRYRTHGVANRMLANPVSLERIRRWPHRVPIRGTSNEESF